MASLLKKPLKLALVQLACGKSIQPASGLLHLHSTHLASNTGLTPVLSNEQEPTKLLTSPMLGARCWRPHDQAPP